MKPRSSIALPSILAGALLLMFPSASKASNLLSNPGFETESGTHCSPSNTSACTTANWSFSGYAYLVGTGSPVENGSYAVQLTGINGVGGDVAQTLNLAAGSYTLSYYLDIVHAPSTTQFWVEWDGQTLPGSTIDGPGSTITTGYQLETLNFTVSNATAGSHALGLYDDWIQGDFYLDNLTLTQNTSTPEPGSLMLFGSGMLGLAGLLRRKIFKA